jgi:hypothetical protein
VRPAAIILSCFSSGISCSYQDLDSTSANKDTNKAAKEKIGPPGVQPLTVLWSSIASDRTTKVARSLSVGKMLLQLIRHKPVDRRCRGGL